MYIASYFSKVQCMSVTRPGQVHFEQSAFTGWQKEGIASQTKHWMAADPSTPTYLNLRREASPYLTNAFCTSPKGTMKVFPATRANDVSQYGGIANRCVALAGAMSEVKSNLNAACSDEVEC